MKRACVAFVVLACVSSTQPAQVAPQAAVAGTARVLQTLHGFDRPESCAFSLDGKWLFVGNCGSDLFGDDPKKVA